MNCHLRRDEASSFNQRMVGAAMDKLGLHAGERVERTVTRLQRLVADLRCSHVACCVPRLRGCMAGLKTAHGVCDGPLQMMNTSPRSTRCCRPSRKALLQPLLHIRPSHHQQAPTDAQREGQQTRHRGRRSADEEKREEHVRGQVSGYNDILPLVRWRHCSSTVRYASTATPVRFITDNSILSVNGRFHLPDQGRCLLLC